MPKDRLLRFDADRMGAICEAKLVAVVIIIPDEATTFETAWAQDFSKSSQSFRSGLMAIARGRTKKHSRRAAFTIV